MIGGLVLLSVAAFAVAAMFGKADPKRIVWLIAILIFGPVIVLIGIDQFASLWSTSSWSVKVGLVLLLVPLARAALRSAFPNAKWLDQLAEGLFRSSVSIIAFPFRLLYRALQLMLDRERRPRRLDAYSGAVGNSPPFEGRRRD